MKLAILSDIHANLPALHAALADVDRWQPDVLVFAGDLINRGPRPLECLDIVWQRRRAGAWVTRGNHEDYILENTLPDLQRTPIEVELYLSSTWTHDRLNGNLRDLALLPFAAQVAAPSGQRVYITHASPRALNDGIYTQQSDSDVRQRLPNPRPAVMVVGHTHRPLIRTVDDTLIVNAGSVGTPFDSDPRLSYARLTHSTSGWQAEIVRLPYDRDQTERDYDSTGYAPECGPIVALMRQEWREARPIYPYWYQKYHEAALAGKIGLWDSVREYLPTPEVTR